MKLVYAKLWLKKYIRYNHNNLDEGKLNRAIINLSHRVYKSHGMHGHNVRQYVREVLVDYSKQELARYNVEFQRPIQARYKHRHFRVPYRRASRFIWTLLKIIGIGILLFIILNLIHSLK